MSKRYISNNMLDEAGKAMVVQDNQQKQVQDTLVHLQEVIDELSNINDENLEDLDSLLKMAELMCLEKGIDIDNIDHDEDGTEADLCELTQEEKDSIKIFNRIIFLYSRSICRSSQLYK